MTGHSSRYWGHHSKHGRQKPLPPGVYSLVGKVDTKQGNYQTSDVFRVAMGVMKQNKAGGIESGRSGYILDEVIRQGLWGNGI